MTHPDHEKNRIAWNEMVEVHWKHPDYRLKEFIAGWNSLKSIERDALGGVAGKSLLHLMCQFGMDTLSWARLGASVTGVDISDASISHANKLKEMVGLSDARFLRIDVLDLIGEIEQKFDVVFQSHGTHCWISDINKWAGVVAHYLKPGGVFFIVDFHPITVLWETENMSYLSREPERYSDEPDYCDREYRIKNELVEWQHPLSEIINALLNAGLVIENMGEYDKSCQPENADWKPDGDYWLPPDGPPRYPLLFSLKARKPLA
ncbi:MAG: class I SAM-dependent methyltransferase [Candidatus Zixiibacteriota bacterium]